MALSHLPVIQNWDCTACGSCCRVYEVVVTEEERQRIEGQGWQGDPEMEGLPPLVRKSWLSGKYRLNHRPGGACVFLGQNNRCRIHERFGAEAKPLACRLYPFALIPAGDQWRVGLRYGCPSATANLGRPVTEHTPDLHRFAQLLERQEGHKPGDLPAPPLQGGQRVDWPDLFRFAQVLVKMLEHGADRLERRLRKCLALAALCRQARFDNLSGGRLSEFLHVVAAGVDAEVPVQADVPPPSWIGRILFRQLAAVYARRDHGELRGSAQRTRLSLFLAGCRFGLGRGRVPVVNGRMRGATFADMEQPAGPVPAEAEAVLERYYLVKLESLQFCGPTNLGLSFWDGLEALLVTCPIILWLSRGLRAESRTQAVRDAICLVDDHFGYNRILKKPMHRFALRTLAQRGELARLTAWYSH